MLKIVYDICTCNFLSTSEDTAATLNDKSYDTSETETDDYDTDVKKQKTDINQLN